MLNFRQLEVFRAMMIAKTVSGAAELLHVSQPGVSRLLKYTEMKLGIELFERHKGRLIPTPEAQELFRELEPIYQKIEGLEWTIDRIARPENRRLRIGCTPSLVRYLLPRILSMVKEKMPDVIMRVDVLSNEELTAYITEQRGDYAVSFYDPVHPLVEAEDFIEGKMVCVFPKGHTLSGRESVSIKDLAGLDLISYHSDTAQGRLVNQLFKDKNVEPVNAVTVRYSDDACSMVEQGLGITLANEFVMMGNAYPALEVVPLEEEASLRIYTLRHNGVSLSHTARLFYNHFKQAMDVLAEQRAKGNLELNIS